MKNRNKKQMQRMFSYIHRNKLIDYFIYYIYSQRVILVKSFGKNIKKHLSFSLKFISNNPDSLIYNTIIFSLFILFYVYTFNIKIIVSDYHFICLLDGKAIYASEICI